MGCCSWVGGWVAGCLRLFFLEEARPASCRSWCWWPAARISKATVLFSQLVGQGYARPFSYFFYFFIFIIICFCCYRRTFLLYYHSSSFYESLDTPFSGVRFGHCRVTARSSSSSVLYVCCHFGNLHLVLAVFFCVGSLWFARWNLWSFCFFDLHICFFFCGGAVLLVCCLAVQVRHLSVTIFD